MRLQRLDRPPAIPHLPLLALLAVAAVGLAAPHVGSAAAAPPERADAPAATRPGTLTRTGQIRARIRKIGAHAFDVDRWLLESLLADPGYLAGDATGAPAKVPGGVGLRLTGIRPGGVFKALGIISGDVVVRVDGAAPDAGRGPAGLLASLGRDGEHVVELLRRRGGTVTMRYTTRAWTETERADADARSVAEGFVARSPANARPADARPVDATPAAVVTPSPAGVADAFDVDHGRLLAELEALEGLDGLARFVPMYQDQRYIGAKIIGVREGGLPTQLGLRTGDVLVAIDGVSLQGTEAWFPLLEALARQARAALTIRRDDAARTLVYTVRRAADAGPARPARAPGEVVARRARLEAAVTATAIDLERVISREVLELHGESLVQEAAAWEASRPQYGPPSARGFRLREGRHGLFFSMALGLSSDDDVILAVDGAEARGLSDVIHALLRRDRVRITGERRGVPFALDLAIRRSADAELARTGVAVDASEREMLLSRAGRGLRATYTYRLSREALAAENGDGRDLAHEAPVGRTEAGGLGLMPHDSVYHALGLRSRDVLVALDGEPVRDRDAALAALIARVRTAPGVTLAVTRGREEVVLVYHGR